MRILFVADGRSPTALSWIEHFTREHEVHLVSTFVCKPELKLASLHIVPVAFSGSADKNSSAGRGLRSLVPTGLRTQMRNWLGPSTVSLAATKLAEIIETIQPDLVHAMRIPYEGMLAAAADPQAPLLVSVWGNDFTLHARSNPFMGAATRRAVQRANALHSDTQRDQRLAQSWGFSTNKPNIVLPGNGGVRSEIFYPRQQGAKQLRAINPRGIRSYVRNDVFFQAIPKVLAKLPEVLFVCPGMQEEPEAMRWVKNLGVSKQVSLLPQLNAQALAESYRAAQVMVSPSTHDGTPNSLLEAMACGVFPICGDLESIREWITPGENGMLVDPNDPDGLANAIVSALQSKQLRQEAARINIRLVAERAEYKTNMQQAENFYRSLLKK